MLKIKHVDDYDRWMAGNRLQMGESSETIVLRMHKDFPELTLVRKPVGSQGEYHHWLTLFGPRALIVDPFRGHCYYEDGTEVRI